MYIQEFAQRQWNRVADSEQFVSIFALIWTALRMYVRHFPTFFAIYAIAVLPASIVAVVLHGPGWQRKVVLLFTLLSDVVAFSAVAIATSDLAIGNRPSIHRLYRLAVWRRLLAVLTNSMVCFVILVTPLASGILIYFLLDRIGQGTPVRIMFSGVLAMALSAPFIAASMLSVQLMYVPIISALEVRANTWRTIRRSISLGRGYVMRSVAILAAGAAAFLLAYAAMYDGLRLAFKLDPDEAAVTVGLVVNLLVTPAVYIAAILLYLDLRSRKEGYGFAELAEDIC